MAKENESAPERVWYASGLRFECQPDCANCCVNHGDYTHVYLEADDERRLYRHLGLTRRRFRARFTEREEEFLVLKMDQPACPFLEDRRCTVYPARPRQCRTFPFWKAHLTSRLAWTRLCGFCPGIDEGELHALGSIQEHLAAMED